MKLKIFKTVVAISIALYGLNWLNDELISNHLEKTAIYHVVGQSNMGSAVAVNYKGKIFILTNEHVIQGSDLSKTFIYNEFRQIYHIKDYKCDSNIDACILNIVENYNGGAYIFKNNYEEVQKVKAIGYIDHNLFVNKGTSVLQLEDIDCNAMKRKCDQGKNVELLQTYYLNFSVSKGMSGGAVTQGKYIIGQIFGIKIYEKTQVQGTGYATPSFLIEPLLKEEYEKDTGRLLSRN